MCVAPCCATRGKKSVLVHSEQFETQSETWAGLGGPPAVGVRGEEEKMEREWEVSGKM